jgi:hypothetical protein
LGDDEYDAFRAAHPNIAAYQTDAIARTPEFRQWQSMNPDSVSITEIKGTNNKVDLIDEPYIKQLQNRIKFLDSTNGLESVENLDGIGMTGLASKLYGHSAIANRPPLTRTDSQAVYQEMLRLNQGSQYIEDSPSLVDSVVRQAVDNVLGPEKRATGGMIERQSTDNRRYL